jgi:hypothetical protein
VPAISGTGTPSALSKRIAARRASEAVPRAKIVQMSIRAPE